MFLFNYSFAKQSWREIQKNVFFFTAAFQNEALLSMFASRLDPQYLRGSSCFSFSLFPQLLSSSFDGRFLRPTDLKMFWKSGFCSLSDWNPICSRMKLGS
jgi:hypothetical protein